MRSAAPVDQHARLAVLALLCLIALAPAPQVYDPLVAPRASDVPSIELRVEDRARDRQIPLRVYLPPATDPAPVALFSHGLGGSREGNAFLGRHWAARGYVAVFLQHPGSDDRVWRDEPVLRRMAAMRRAANADNFLLRVADVSAVLDEFARWHRGNRHPLAGRLDLEHVGMSGHSFGALTTQAVSGQTALGGRVSYADGRIDAAVAFSPSGPRAGDPARAFGSVSIPWLLMTGTKDVAPIGDADLESRLAVFPALPPGGKYELVLDGAEHSAFTDRALPGDTDARNPNHHRVMLALTTAFWDAYLRNDAAARAWLDGPAPGRLLEPGDRWQKK